MIRVSLSSITYIKLSVIYLTLMMVILKESSLIQI